MAENHDLEAALSAKTPLVIGVVLGLGFLLLLIALQAPLIAAVGVLTNLLATAAAFGVAKWIFQDGALHSLLGFQSQGFLDAWGPVFFFAMIFAISMDYTVFLLSSAKEHWDRTHDPKDAMVGGLAHSGRVIFAAAAVMVAVFFTFALSGPLPPKEMGVILGVAVLLDAMLIRLLLVPVLLRLMGRWAWYLPRWAHRVLPDVTLRTLMRMKKGRNVTNHARAVADGMMSGIAPGSPAPDRARPHLHRPSGARMKRRAPRTPRPAPPVVFLDPEVPNPGVRIQRPLDSSVALPWVSVTFRNAGLEGTALVLGVRWGALDHELLVEREPGLEGALRWAGVDNPAEPSGLVRRQSFG